MSTNTGTGPASSVDCSTVQNDIENEEYGQEAKPDGMIGETAVSEPLITAGHVVSRDTAPERSRSDDDGLPTLTPDSSDSISKTTDSSTPRTPSQVTAQLYPALTNKNGTSSSGSEKNAATKSESKSLNNANVAKPSSSTSSKNSINKNTASTSGSVKATAHESVTKAKTPKTKSKFCVLC